MRAPEYIGPMRISKGAFEDDLADSGKSLMREVLKCKACGFAVAVISRVNGQVAHVCEDCGVIR